MKRTPLIVLSLMFSTSFTTLKAQDKDLLNLVDDKNDAKQIVTNAFKSNRVINAHSMEFLAPGTMDFRILHRFGLLSEGTKNFFGLDQASMRMGFDFGISKNLQAGVGRSTFKKELDGYLKFGIVRQSTGNKSFPATVAFVAGATINTLPFTDTARKDYFSSRVAYYFQTIIGRKFNDKFTLQLSPTVVHNNYVPLVNQPNDVFAIGVGGRLKISKRTAFTWDYSYLLNGKEKDVNYIPLSIGVDIETGGHVFQLHVSNAVGMNERAFITETTNNWSKGKISFGFNLSRMFQLKTVKVD